MAREAGIKQDIHKSGWEESEFPIVCDTCLGDSQFVRMTRANFDKECKICARPFTVFRWKPGPKARYKKTEICQTCAKLKNVCQTCLLDLQYGLPVQVRDSLLPPDEQDIVPKSDVNREYFADQNVRKMAEGEGFNGKIVRNETLSKLARTTPYYKRNAPHVCSFFARGECTRGAECPYRHEMPTEGPLAEQNIKDRYYGHKDPVAKKILDRAASWEKLTPPEDQSIKTLWVGCLAPFITEQDMRDVFYAYGEIEQIQMLGPSFCAFVSYTLREGAEKAAEELGMNPVIGNCTARLAWAKPQQTAAIATASLPGVPPPPGLALPSGLPVGFSGPAFYPSMNPAQDGTRPEGMSTIHQQSGSIQSTGS